MRSGQLVPALFITVDGDNESHNKTSTKPREAQHFARSAAPARCQIVARTRSLSLSLTHTPPPSLTLDLSLTHTRIARGREAGETAEDEADAALSAAVPTPAAWWPDASVGRVRIVMPNNKGPYSLWQINRLKGFEIKIIFLLLVKISRLNCADTYFCVFRLQNKI